MVKSRHPFTWTVAPVFAEDGFDVIARLQTYDNPDYGIRRLNADERTFVGEITFHRARRDIAGKISDQKSTKSYSSNSVSELDDLTDLAANDISDVYGWEKEILDSPFWFSYCDGVFVFMRTVESEDAAHEQIDYLFKDYALAFLRTLGPILG